MPRSRCDVSVRDVVGIDIRVELVCLGEPVAGLRAYLARIAFLFPRLAIELLGGDPGLLGLGSCGGSVGLAAARLDGAHLGLLAELACAEAVTFHLLRVAWFRIVIPMIAISAMTARAISAQTHQLLSSMSVLPLLERLASGGTGRYPKGTTRFRLAKHVAGPGLSPRGSPRPAR